jgi:hypothetical protein
VETPKKDPVGGVVVRIPLIASEDFNYKRSSRNIGGGAV